MPNFPVCLKCLHFNFKSYLSLFSGKPGDTGNNEVTLTSIPKSASSDTISHIRWSYFLNSGVLTIHTTPQTTNKTPIVSTQPPPNVVIDVELNSPHCMEEIENNTAYVHDNIIPTNFQSDNPIRNNEE